MNKVDMDMNSSVNNNVTHEKSSKKNHYSNVEIRRDWVQRLFIRGNTQWEIAKSLNISQPTVSRDIKWIRSVAKKELKDHLEKKLPEEYHKYLVGIDEVLRNAWDIALSGAVDKTRLQALQFVIECCKHRMNVIMNPPVLTKSNNILKPFKQNSHFDADSTIDSDSIIIGNQKEIKKNQYEE